MHGVAKDDDEARRAIMAHIDSIFTAYVRKDREAIRRTHTRDWTGFQVSSAKIERGIEDYMANVEVSLDMLDGTGYEILDSEVQIFGDVAIVYYVAKYAFRSRDGNSGAMLLRAIDVYRKEADEWIQCGSHITRIPPEGILEEDDG